MLKAIALLLLITAIAPASANALQGRVNPTEKPKLIVQLVVSQMRADCIARYWDKLPDGGFKLLVNEGISCKNARYSYLLTQPYPGIATISTGTNPSVHGIISDKWLSRASGQEVHAVADDKASTVGGSFFSGKASAKNLTTSTLADELILSSPKSKVVGVSLDAGSAILLTGHNASGVYWLDRERGSFVTSSYFTESLPAWVDTFNSKGLAKLYTNREWRAINPIGTYGEADTSRVKSPESKRWLTEKLKVLTEGVIGRPQQATGSFSALAESPFGNSLTKDMAIAAVVGEGLGSDEHTDLLCLTFTANRGIGQKYGPHSLEMEDAYLRLDKELAHLMEFLSLSVGRENVLVVLTADQGVAASPDYLERYRIPGGYFDAKRAMILLGSYLNARYGQGAWVTAYYEKQIFLNRELVERSKLNLADFQQRVADFMLEFSGVANSTTAHTLQTASFANGPMEKFQNSFYPRRSGDVIITLEPGWVERNGSVASGNSAYNYDAHVSLIWYGWKLKHRVVLSPVDMQDIAPTLSELLGIAWPNGSTGIPIREILE